jgi:steroid 5-alpha-reductase/3-oxo-5-alpha-steroid 4-dehydrogenase 1
MESPSVLLFAAIYWAGDNARATVPLMLFSLWQFHYIYRTFIFPLRIRASGKRMPVSVVAMAIAFNCLNSYINARWVSHFGNYPDTWLTTTAFLAGVVCFGFGWGINQYSDTVLIRLRQPGESGYAIPRGGLFRWVSCPNYLGEMLQWFGWAIACWSMAGAAFAIFTLANLMPRAVANHRWYQKEFPDYPRSRRAVIPYWI